MIYPQSAEMITCKSIRAAVALAYCVRVAFEVLETNGQSDPRRWCGAGPGAWRKTGRRHFRIRGRKIPKPHRPQKNRVSYPHSFILPAASIHRPQEKNQRSTHRPPFPRI